MGTGPACWHRGGEPRAIGAAGAGTPVIGTAGLDPRCKGGGGLTPVIGTAGLDPRYKDGGGWTSAIETVMRGWMRLCRCREAAPPKQDRLPGEVGGISSSSACDRGYPSHPILGGLQAMVVDCFAEGGVYFQGMLQSLLLCCIAGILSPI